MISTSPKFVAARARTLKYHRRNAGQSKLGRFFATGSQNDAQIVSSHAWPTPTRRKTNEASTHNLVELQL